MYKVVVLTDKEAADGFRLSGVDVIEVEKPEDAQVKLNELINSDTTGVIAIDEEFMEYVDERTKQKIERIYRPIVVPIPSKGQVEVVETRRDYLAGLIRRAIGFDIKLGD